MISYTRAFLSLLLFLPLGPAGGLETECEIGLTGPDWPSCASFLPTDFYRFFVFSFVFWRDKENWNVLLCEIELKLASWIESKGADLKKRQFESVQRWIYSVSGLSGKVDQETGMDETRNSVSAPVHDEFKILSVESRIEMIGSSVY